MKEQLEKAGVTDETKVAYIDIDSDKDFVFIRIHDGQVEAF